MLPSKDIEQMNGKEIMTHTYAAYKRPTSEEKCKQTESEGWGKKRF